jgi:hypothetical protein
VPALAQDIGGKMAVSDSYPMLLEFKAVIEKHYPLLGEDATRLVSGFVLLYCEAIGSTKDFLSALMVNGLAEARDINLKSLEAIKEKLNKKKILN